MTWTKFSWCVMAWISNLQNGYDGSEVHTHTHKMGASMWAIRAVDHALHLHVRGTDTCPLMTWGVLHTNGGWVQNLLSACLMMIRSMENFHFTLKACWGVGGGVGVGGGCHLWSWSDDIARLYIFMSGCDFLLGFKSGFVQDSEACFLVTSWSKKKKKMF